MSTWDNVRFIEHNLKKEENEFEEKKIKEKKIKEKKIEENKNKKEERNVRNKGYDIPFCSSIQHSLPI